MLIIRRINCINTISDVSLYVGDRQVCTCTPNGLYRVTYTRYCIDAIDPPDDEHSGARNM